MAELHLTPDVLLASACLPTLFQEIDGEPYWDGGYATITPLVRECASGDTILVQVNPVERPGTPRSARDILDRLNEISFNSPLLKELRMIAVLRQAVDPGSDEGARWAGMRIHRVSSKAMVDLGYSSKLNAEWAFLCMLRDEGRRCATAFVEQHGQDIGKRCPSTSAPCSPKPESARPASLHRSTIRDAQNPANSCISGRQMPKRQHADNYGNVDVAERSISSKVLLT